VDLVDAENDHPMLEVRGVEEPRKLMSLQLFGRDQYHVSRFDCFGPQVLLRSGDGVCIDTYRLESVLLD
jgi:hypothetical protein